MKELTESQVNNIKEKLIKFKNELIRKNKVNNRIKKDLNNYNGIKDNRYLFNENEDVDEDISIKSITVDIRNKLLKNGDKLIKKGLYYIEEMKSLESTEIKNIKEKLIIFKNELIRKYRINNRIKKILTITMEILNTKVLKILDIYLMKKMFTMTLMILNICLMKMKTIMKTRKIKLKQHTKKILKEVSIMLRK